jgi:hypothetical protein
VAFRSPASLIAEITGIVDDDPWSPDAMTISTGLGTMIGDTSSALGAGSSQHDQHETGTQASLLISTSRLM